jgi:DNA-binding transcriptional regulator GbsR (MarR family)
MSKSPKRLSDVTRKFITHWGEMGCRWGLNRTVAQVHALLYLAERPLTADDIVAALGVARSNVSTSLKELQGWGVIRMVHVPGERREHFSCIADVWEMFRVIVNERRRREFDPTLVVVRECVQESTAESAVVQERIRAMEGFMSSMSEAFDQIRVLPPSALAGLLGAAGWIRSLLPKDKK